MTRNETTLLLLIVLVAALALFATFGVEIHHLLHQIGRDLQPSSFGGGR